MTNCANHSSRMLGIAIGARTDPLIMDSASFLDELLHNSRETYTYYVPYDTSRGHTSPESPDPAQTALVRFDAAVRTVVLHYILHSPGVTTISSLRKVLLYCTHVALKDIYPLVLNILKTH